MLYATVSDVQVQSTWLQFGSPSCEYADYCGSVRTAAYLLLTVYFITVLFFQASRLSTVSATSGKLVSTCTQSRWYTCTCMAPVCLEEDDRWVSVSSGKG